MSDAVVSFSGVVSEMSEAVVSFSGFILTIAEVVVISSRIFIHMNTQVGYPGNRAATGWYFDDKTLLLRLNKPSVYDSHLVVRWRGRLPGEH